MGRREGTLLWSGNQKIFGGSFRTGEAVSKKS